MCIASRRSPTRFSKTARPASRRCSTASNGQWVPYTRPGFPLFRTITPGADIYVFANHGLVVAADTLEAAVALLATVGRRLARPLQAAPTRPARGVERAGYRFADAPALTPHGAKFAAAGSLYPDHLVFLGSGAALIDSVVGSPPVILAPGFPPLVREDLAPAPLALAAVPRRRRGAVRAGRSAALLHGAARVRTHPLGRRDLSPLAARLGMIRALGVDVGTSGVRAAIVDATKSVVAYAAEPFAPAGARDPSAWVGAVEAAMARLDLDGVEAVAIDGTSGTLVAIDARGDPLAEGSMYNDEAAPDDRAEAARAAPAHASPTSPLARALGLKRRFRPAKILHQADFIAFRLFGETFSDENNALKTGYDPVARRWPGFIAAFGLDGLLPDVLPAGAVVARRGGRGIVAGTTDGCAAFLAAGAERIGDGVTSLGSTIVLKLLVDHPVDDPETGVYSHRIGDLWLAGGSSNSGGAVLAHHFRPNELEALAARIDPSRPTGLDYYPLLKTGERFPSRRRARAEADAAPRRRRDLPAGHARGDERDRSGGLRQARCALRASTVEPAGGRRRRAQSGMDAASRRRASPRRSCRR